MGLWDTRKEIKAAANTVAYTPDWAECEIKPYYSDSQVIIFNGDCRQIMPLLPEADMILTDPPYDEKTHKGTRYGFRETSSEIAFAPLDDIPALLTLMFSKSKGWVVCFCSLEMFGAYRDAAPDNWVRAGFWRRPDGVPQFTGDRPGQPGEGIAVMNSHKSKKMAWNGAGKHGFWECPVERDYRCHPTQKPIKLMKDLVNDFSHQGSLILDPFMGSGTTLKAAKLLGRRAIGIEMNEKYCEAAANRMMEEI